MRCLQRNLRSFYYALPTGMTNVTNGDYLTGDMKVTYAASVEVYGNVAPPTGKVFIDLFGAEARYDRVIVLDDPQTPIVEGAVLCIDTPPSYDADDNLIYDHIVRKVARSLNSTTVAVSKVECGEGEVRRFYRAGNTLIGRGFPLISSITKVDSVLKCT